MKIAVGIPVLHNFKGCVELIHSLNREDVLFYIQDNWNENLGVAAAWNVFLKNAIDDNVDLLIISNDDVVFEPGAIGDIEDDWFSRPIGSVLMTANSDEGCVGYACFMVEPKRIVQEVGYFDEENFFPAYFEDNDYDRRIQVKGLLSSTAKNFKVSHKGSVTQFWNGEEDRVVSHEKFRENRSNYIAKWGGMPGEETFLTPYNK